jgi:hypothetical protein
LASFRMCVASLIASICVRGSEGGREGRREGGGVKLWGVGREGGKKEEPALGLEDNFFAAFGPH